MRSRRHSLVCWLTTAPVLLAYSQEIPVERLNSSYRVAKGGTSGFFVTGQKADLMLSGIGFNNTGGPLLFNHPGGVATDGTRLLLADRNNNRILIWSRLPEANTPPDLVLGQKDFTSNDPGTGLDQLNWPVSVATDGRRVVVADTYNDRILVWNSFPTRSGQAADFALGGRPKRPERPGLPPPRSLTPWPWAVWTDGQKLIVTSTGSGSVLIWNQFPPAGDAPPALVLRAGGDFGTPRTIACDGRHLMIGDHNAFRKNAGNFFWKSFPTRDDQPYDFHVASPTRDPHGEVLWSPVFTPDGRFIALGALLYVWKSFPGDDRDGPDLAVGVRPGPQQERLPRPGYRFEAGDASSLCLAGRRLYACQSNGNKLVAFNTVPTAPDVRPDFAIGSPDPDTNTLRTHRFITNPVPASDGVSLFVSSDFDRTLSVWKRLPDESGAHPDFVYHLPEGPWANALHGGTLVLAGRRTVYVWRKPPRNGEQPDRVVRGRLGGVELRELKGVALDDRRFYLADTQADRIYVWEGIPDDGTPPKLSLPVRRPERLSSDGRYLAATTLDRPGGGLMLYALENLTAQTQPVDINTRHLFNLPSGVLVSGGALYVADTPWSRVVVWRRVEDALAGRPPDVLLGARDLGERVPEIGQDKLFWPGAASFDGRYLWVGEFKFSGRVLRFSPSPSLPGS
ncbi:MAG: hypothetical protein FJ291_21325 [Planctomycetes bacterium]|nr:hypothetical protein [Planctomycetota bacterium]